MLCFFFVLPFTRGFLAADQLPSGEGLPSQCLAQCICADVLNPGLCDISNLKDAGDRLVRDKPGCGKVGLKQLQCFCRTRCADCSGRAELAVVAGKELTFAFPG